jgi:hypothetical protein
MLISNSISVPSLLLSIRKLNMHKHYPPTEIRRFIFPHVLRELKTSALSPKVMRPGHEADQSPPISVVVKKSGSIHLLPIRLHGVELN